MIGSYTPSLIILRSLLMYLHKFHYTLGKPQNLKGLYNFWYLSFSNGSSDPATAVNLFIFLVVQPEDKKTSYKRGG